MPQNNGINQSKPSWSAMWKQIKEYVKEHPGATLDDILGHIQVNQRTWGAFGDLTLARQGIVKTVKQGLISGVVIKTKRVPYSKDDRYREISTFYPKEVAA